MYMVMSQKYKPPHGADEVMSSLQRLCLHICESCTRLQWKSTSSSSMNMRARNTHTAQKIERFVQNITTQDKNSSIVKVLSGHLQFGEVRMFLEHNVNCTLQTWAVVDVSHWGKGKINCANFKIPFSSRDLFTLTWLVIH